MKMNGFKVYVAILLSLLGIHILIWSEAGHYSWSIFIAAFVGMGSTASIYQFLCRKTMVMGKFDLEPSQKGIRVFFVSFATLLFVIGYGLAIGMFPTT